MWPTRRPVPFYRASDAHEQPRVTDPLGFFLSGLFKAIGNFFKSVFKFVGQVFKAILNSQIGRSIIQIAVCAFGPAACVAASGVLTLATGGSPVAAVKSMAMTFVSVASW